MNVPMEYSPSATASVIQALRSGPAALWRAVTAAMTMLPSATGRSETSPT